MKSFIGHLLLCIPTMLFFGIIVMGTLTGNTEGTVGIVYALVIPCALSVAWLIGESK